MQVQLHVAERQAVRVGVVLGVLRRPLVLELARPRLKRQAARNDRRRCRRTSAMLGAGGRRVSADRVPGAPPVPETDPPAAAPSRQPRFSHTPDRSGLPSGVFGAGAVRFTLPSAVRGTPARPDAAATGRTSDGESDATSARRMTARGLERRRSWSTSSSACRRAGAANLCGVIVRVHGVDLEPRVHRVAAVLGVRAFARPVGFAHAVENLGRRAPRRLERLERRLDRPVVVQPPRELVLVVADDRRACRSRAAAAGGWPTSSRCRRGDARSRAPTTCPAPDARPARRRSRRPAPRQRRGSRPCTGRSASVESACPSSARPARPARHDRPDVALPSRLRDARRRRFLRASPARGGARSGASRSCSNASAGVSAKCSRSMSCSAIAPHSAIGLKSSTSSQNSRP